MTKADWIWMPHAGHYICGEWCRFHLCTYVNGFVVSTVGDYMPDRDTRRYMRSTDSDMLRLQGDEFDHYYIKKYGYHEVGCGRLFETMVFPAENRHPEDDQCCPYKCNHDDSELEAKGYNTAKEATEGHYELCFKYDEIPFPKSLLKQKLSDIDVPYQFMECMVKWMTDQNSNNKLIRERIEKLEKSLTNKSPFSRMPF